MDSPIAPSQKLVTSPTIAPATDDHQLIREGSIVNTTVPRGPRRETPFRRGTSATIEFFVLLLDGFRYIVAKGADDSNGAVLVIDIDQHSDAGSDTSETLWGDLEGLLGEKFRHVFITVDGTCPRTGHRVRSPHDHLGTLWQ